MNDPRRLEQALLEAIRHLGADSGTIHLKDPDRSVLRLSASHGVPSPVLEIVREVPWGKGMAGLAAERAQPVDACNIQTDTSGDVRPGARATGLQGALVVPMLLGNEVVGTLGVGCKTERTFTPEETSWMMAFAGSLAQEIATR
jgi:signal transduction protein with GAF and PtsI domain